jgi:lysylphosphatidylglycerol synthetase-like protein (DUF2156 family)
MSLANAFIGLIQLLIAIILAVVALYIGYSTFSRITKGMDERQELAKGNVAVGIIIAAIFFAIALVVQSGVAGISMGISKALEGDWISLIMAFIQLILGIVLAIAAIYIALNVLDRLTKGIDEYAKTQERQCRHSPYDGRGHCFHRNYHSIRSNRDYFGSHLNFF